MTTRQTLLARRRELIQQIQDIADGYDKLASETEQKMAAWKRHQAMYGLTRAEARGYEYGTH